MYDRVYKEMMMRTKEIINKKLVIKNLHLLIFFLHFQQKFYYIFGVNSISKLVCTGAFLTIIFWKAFTGKKLTSSLFIL